MATPASYPHVKSTVRVLIIYNSAPYLLPRARNRSERKGKVLENIEEQGKIRVSMSMGVAPRLDKKKKHTIGKFRKWGVLELLISQMEGRYKKLLGLCTTGVGKRRKEWGAKKGKK